MYRWNMHGSDKLIKLWFLHASIAMGPAHNTIYKAKSIVTQSVFTFSRHMFLRVR